MPPIAKLSFPAALAPQHRGGALNVFSGASSYTGGIDSGQAVALVVVFVSLILIILVVIYIMYLIKTQDYDRGIVLNKAVSLQTKDAFKYSSLMKTSPDNAASYSFWIYINNFVPQGKDGSPLIIWASETSNGAGTTADVTASSVAGPVAFMDYRTNRMYMSFYLNDGVTKGKPATLKDLIPEYANTTGDMRFKEGMKIPYLTMPVDYVPMQRWVHYTAVIHQNSVTLYQDGDVYSVRSVSDLDDMATNPAGSMRPLFDTTVNGRTIIPTLPLTLGGSTSVPASNTSKLSAFISSFTYYNHELNQLDIRRIYGRGPHTTYNWFRWFGLGYLRFQTPIVWESESANTQDSVPTV